MLEDVKRSGPHELAQAVFDYHDWQAGHKDKDWSPESRDVIGKALWHRVEDQLRAYLGRVPREYARVTG